MINYIIKLINENDGKYYKVIFISLAIFSLYLLISGFNYHFYLTNEYTPGGDGGRIYYYLKYLEKVPEAFPFWQAHKHYGYPLLADVENHMPLSLVLDTESPYFNIHLNLLFFFLTAIFAFSCRSIARSIGLTQISSFIVGVFIILTVPMARVFMHGSITTFTTYVLSYSAIAILLYVISNSKTKDIYLLIFIPIVLAWSVRFGYYLLLVFYIPLFIFLSCAYLKQKLSFLHVIKKNIILTISISIFFILLSMPFLLPIIDGIVLSNTFAAEMPSINIHQRDLYYYYFGLWPFILLAVLFSRGLFRKYSLLFLAMASLNFILIFFDYINFKAFFDAWANTPILKNIRWQHPFRELSSIAAAFCAGIFIDSIRYNVSEKFCKEKIINYFLIALFCLLMLIVAYKQTQLDLPVLMVVISIIFIAIAMAAKRKDAVLAFCFVLAVSMSIDFDKSPFNEKLNKAYNTQEFQSYEGEYFWHRGRYGKDKYTPYFPYGAFSMVFMNEYRNLLSLLYDQDITAQRPHWVGRVDNIDRNQIEKANSQIASLMGISIGRPKSQNWNSPFRIYNTWIVKSDSNAIKLMQENEFTPEGPIILADEPKLPMEEAIPFQGTVELTGKTADTISLSVKTNQNSIVLIPEIYHRNWYAWVNDKNTRVLKAYASMRAVAVPPGEHKIFLRFIYWPFYWGLGIAFIAFVYSIVGIYRYKSTICNWLGPSQLQENNTVTDTFNSK